MSQTLVIFASDRQWRLGLMQGSEPLILDVPPGADPSPAATAQSVARVLQDKRYAGQGAILAIPSNWCLSVPISTRHLPAKPSREELLYMLEEHVPIAAEEMAADFVETDGQVFAVAAIVARLRPLIDAFEASGIAIEAIYPASLLTMQHQLQSDRQTDAILQCDEGAIDLVLLAGSKPVGWYVCTPDGCDAAVYARAALAERGGTLQIAAVPLEGQAFHAIKNTPGVNICETRRPPSAADAVLAVTEVEAGRLDPWINLRRDALAPGSLHRAIQRPLRYVAISAAIFCICLSLAMLCRGWRYGSIAAQNEQQHQQVFQQLFPGRSVPPDIPAYLASEQRKLQALAGQTSDSPAQISSLLILHEVLSRMPTDVRYRLTRMYLSDERITLEGETRSHSDADAMAAALRQCPRFQIEPPRTELTSQAVVFAINGKITLQHHPAGEAAR